MKKNLIVTAILGAIIFIINNVAYAAGNENSKEVSWYYLGTNEKFAKYFDPASVKVTKKAKTDNDKEIATEIEAWTKVTYSDEGAAHIIKDYGIANTIPDPNTLSYSLALLKINPQTRTVQYMREDFYNADGKVIWSGGEGRVKEINSHSFDEDFYAAIVDEVFRQGEVDRKNAKDRWIDLWTNTNDKGETIKVTADTTTMQLKGTNLIVWEWEETKNSEGQVIKIRFMKKAVNLPQGTERIAAGSTWTPSKNWTDIDDEYDGAYRSVKEGDPDYKGLNRLRAYAKGYSTWVTRYSITGNTTGNSTEKPKPNEDSDKKDSTQAPSYMDQEKTRD